MTYTQAPYKSTIPQAAIDTKSNLYKGANTDSFPSFLYLIDEVLAMIISEDLRRLDDLV